MRKYRQLAFLLFVSLFLSSSIFLVSCKSSSKDNSDSLTLDTTVAELSSSEEKPTDTPTSPTMAPTYTPTPVPTDTPTPIPTDTPTPSPTPSPAPVPTNTPTPKPTATPKPTKMPEPTNTPIPSDPTLPPTESTPEPTSAPSSTEPTKPKYDLKKIEYAIKVIKNHGFKVWEHLHNGQYEKKDGKWEIVGGDWKEYDVDGSIMFTRTIYYRGKVEWSSERGVWRVSYQVTPDGRIKYGKDYDYSYWELGTDLDELLNGITVEE